MITEVVQGLGSWSITLVDAPRELTDRLLYFGHVAVIPGRVNPAEYGDELLGMARYVGVLTKRQASDDSLKLGGAGMALWLGDADDKGEILETPVILNGQSFVNSIRALLGNSTAVVEGTLHSVPGTYTGRHQWESRRKAIHYVCQTFGAEWRVNNDATLDAGRVEDLYVTDPVCVIVRKGAEGRDLDLTALAGEMELSQDVEDWTSRVVLLAEGQGSAIATGSADIASNPYLDLRGQPVKRTRIISESGTATGNAKARAQLQLNRFTGTRNALRLNAADYEIRGTFSVGDYVWVYDPDSGLFDTGAEVTFRGRRINPIKLRVVESSWPVTADMTVAYRHQDGTWHDLTRYVKPESGATTIGVGELGRSLTSSGFEPVGSRPAVDSTIPGVVSWITPFQTATYIDGLGNTRASILVAWQQPLNADGSTILDGDHYEIAYGVSPASEWQTAYAPWGDLQALIQDLSPGVAYDFRIRLVDTSGNAGAWSAVETAVASPDTIPPSTPAAPTVAASYLALQVRHDLGRATGGTYNLELDLDHLEIHVGSSADFTPDETTLRATTPATAGMMQAGVPAIATVQVEETTQRWVRVIAVDASGNRSAPSAAASSTAMLIDEAHITSLTVDKIAAGTIRSNWVLGASIATAQSGQRVELNASGLHGYNSAGTELVTLSSTGSFALRSATSGARIELDTSGLRIIDSGGSQLVNLGSSGSFLIRSSTSGARVEIDTSGLRVINASGTALVDLNDSGSFTLRSASSGARIQIDTTGIEAYNASGARTVDINSADGSVTIIGRLSSSETANKRLEINPGPTAGAYEPEIRFYEEYPNEYHYITQDIGGTHQLEIGSALQADRRCRMRLTSSGWELGFEDSARTWQGGYISAFGELDIGYAPSGAHLTFTSGGYLNFYGRLGWSSSSSMWVRGSIQLFDSTFSVTVWTIGYGITMSSTPIVVISFFDTGAASNYSALVTDRTASGFTFRQSAPAQINPHEVMFLGWRQ
ncbi:MAG: hypothetical protein IRZ07_04150 [Microbispora sp.]|nr:hypothetical protein [Microbispora sp.]